MKDGKMSQLDPLEINRQAFEATEDSNVFVIMRFEKQCSVLSSIENAIKNTLNDYNLNAVLARDVLLYSEIWSNIRFCMDHCRYAITVFDRTEGFNFSPNITLELGYMLALKRPCLILKDESIDTMPTDIIGRLYERFNSNNAETSVSLAVRKWLNHLGHTRVPPAETIVAQDDIDSNKLRTKRILRELEKARQAKAAGVIRHAGSLSSLGISDEEKELLDREYHELLKEEREAILDLLNIGWTIRILICPESQIDFVELELIDREYATKMFLPRYEQLLKVINDHMDNPRLQIAYTQHLPHQNIIVIKEEIVFIGRRFRWGTGFPSTTIIFDPAVVQDEAKELDVAFTDSACILLQRETLVEADYGSAELKVRVVKKLKNCRRRLRARLKQKHKSSRNIDS